MVTLFLGVRMPVFGTLFLISLEGSKEKLSGLYSKDNEMRSQHSSQREGS